MERKTWLIISGLAGVSLLTLGLGLGLGLSANHEPTEKCINSAHAKCFQNGAVATDDARCSVVGANILRKGGSAADAAIATLLCQVQGSSDDLCGNNQTFEGYREHICLHIFRVIPLTGVVNNYHSGIGGGAFFVIYDPHKDEKSLFFNCREKAPLNATGDMMQGNPLNAQHGPLVRFYKQIYELCINNFVDFVKTGKSYRSTRRSEMHG